MSHGLGRPITGSTLVRTSAVPSPWIASLVRQGPAPLGEPWPNTAGTGLPPIRAARGRGAPGRRSDDVIFARGGNDVVDGRGGNDLICGGAGNDTLTGGTGNDRVEGGDGNDALTGGDGDDTLFGDAGNDVLSGGPGSNANDGGPGTDVCTSPATGPGCNP
ncbi:calcium-binding protein [Streptomyces sp. NPDC008238]